MVIYVDIDGTICLNTFGSYEDAKPRPEQIGKINFLYEQGNKIVYYTARGSTTGIDWRDLTTRQLERWGCLYHELHLGKPEYDIWIDDKSMKIEDLNEKN